MIKELSATEVSECFGGIRLEERVYGAFDALLFGAAATGLFSASVFITVGISTVAAPIIIVAAPVLIAATYKNYTGKKYTVDLDWVPD